MRQQHQPPEGRGLDAARPGVTRKPRDAAALRPQHEAVGYSGSASDLARTAQTGHDFGRISVRRETPARLQRKLAVDAPGSRFEQQADRIADRIIHTPAQQRPEHIRSPRVRLDGNQLSEIAAPAIVDEALRSPGQPLDPTTRTVMESQLEHDFSRVRIHTGAREAQSAAAIGARAYTVRDDVVFGAGQYAPGTSEGQRLIAHELVHVAQAVATPLVQRDVVNDAAGNATDFEFVVGTELEQAFVQLAKQLAANGVISDRDLRLLRAHALKRHGTVNDHERMFMAGLLNAANVKTLQRTAIAPKASVTFTLASITANVQHVIDLDRDAPPVSVTKPVQESQQAMIEFRFGAAATKFAEAETAASREITANAGSFKAQAAALIAFAQANNVPLYLVLQAMLAAASDNSAGDKALAGIAYAIAASSHSSIAGDLLSGKVKVDALIPGAFGRLPIQAGVVAFYVTAAQKSGLKGDTIYLQTSIDIDNLKDRSEVVHELRHAEEDKGASPTAKPSFPDKNQMELRGYRAQARYILEQMVPKTAADQRLSAQQILATPNALVLGALLLEAQTNQARFRPALEVIFAAAPAPFTQTPAQLTHLLATPAATVEAAVLKDIDTAYGLAPGAVGVVEGLAGESLVHWISRI